MQIIKRVNTIQERLVNLIGHKENPAISIVVNKDTPSPSDEKFKIKVRNAIRAAVDKLTEQGYATELVESLRQRMEDIESTIAYEKGFQSVVLFISPIREELFELPFESTDKVIVDDSFEIRDLLRTVNRSFQYHVLVLSRKKTRFFDGFSKYLTERHDGDIPEGSDSYFEERVMVAFDPGKTDAEAIRLYVSDLDDYIRTHSDCNAPLIVMGDEKLIGYFRHYTKKCNKILGEIPGSYDNAPEHEIKERVLAQLDEFIQIRDRQLLERVQKDIDALNYVSGIQETWTAAAMREVRILLVEQGYKVEGYSFKNGLALALDKPENEPCEYHADAIDDLAEMVLSQGGEVYFVQPGLLEKYDRVLATLRFG